MKFSICTSYYNRRPQLINTLKTIANSKQITNVEMIVVNDCSSDEHLIDDLPEQFPFLKVINMDKDNRWYTNPCVPFNVAIKEAVGDIIMIQNPECLHVGDILSDVEQKLTDNNYLTYAVYSIDKETTKNLYDLPYDHKHINHMITSQLQPFVDINYVSEGQCCWYNHSKYRPKAYHFVSAMTKKNMDDLNGFDERYSNGVGFDDDELLFRISLKGLKVEIHDEPFAVHQWHYSENRFLDGVNIAEEYNKNQKIFNDITKHLKSPHVS